MRAGHAAHVNTYRANAWTPVGAGPRLGSPPTGGTEAAGLPAAAAAGGRQSAPCPMIRALYRCEKNDRSTDSVP